MRSIILKTRQYKTKRIKTVLCGPKSRQIHETRESLGPDPTKNLVCDMVALTSTAEKGGGLLSKRGWDR